MKEEEINKTIAKYMSGLWCRSCHCIWETTYFETGKDNCNNCLYGTQNLYTKSLDALIPVVEKLECREFGYSYSCETAWLICGNKELKSRFNGQESSKSPSLALATACVKVIQEL